MPIKVFVGKSKQKSMSQTRLLCKNMEKCANMTRAEEAALRVYPNVEQPVWDESYPKTLFVRHTERNAFIKGYEQAEKDTIERAIVWLKEHADSYIVDLTPTYPDAPQNIIIGGMCWEHLKQVLEEEK